MTCVGPPGTTDAGHTLVPALSGPGLLTFLSCSPRMHLLNNARVDAWQSVSHCPAHRIQASPQIFASPHEAHRAGSGAHELSTHPIYSWLFGQRDVRHLSHLCTPVSGMTRHWFVYIVSGWRDGSGQRRSNDWAINPSSQNALVFLDGLPEEHNNIHSQKPPRSV